MDVEDHSRRLSWGTAALQKAGASEVQFAVPRAVLKRPRSTQIARMCARRAPRRSALIRAQRMCVGGESGLGAGVVWRSREGRPRPAHASTEPAGAIEGGLSRARARHDEPGARSRETLGAPMCVPGLQSSGRGR
jgi:hypothetical protein